MRIPPKNYYPDLNRRKNGLDTAAAEISALEDRPVLPTPADGDLGKVPKVNSEGGYSLDEDSNTIVIANPETESTERLDKLTVGTTTYLVNEDVLPTVLKAVRLKINTIHGSDQNVAIKRLRMKNTLNGDYYQYGGSDTCTCSTGADSSGLIDNGTFGEFMIPSSSLPFYVDVTFADGIDTTQYNEFGMICSAYESATPLSIEVLVSSDGEHFVSVATMTNTPFIYEGYVTLYNFGDVDIKMPDYTSADRGKFLGIDNTDHVVWDNVPKELPTVTSADEGKVLTVDSQGAWGAERNINIYEYTRDGSLNITLPQISDVVASINNGKCPIIKNGSGNTYFHVTLCSQSELIVERSEVFPNSFNITQISFDITTGIGTMTSKSISA